MTQLYIYVAEDEIYIAEDEIKSETKSIFDRLKQPMSKVNKKDNWQLKAWNLNNFNTGVQIIIYELFYNAQHTLPSLFIWRSNAAGIVIESV